MGIRSGGQGRNRQAQRRPQGSAQGQGEIEEEGRALKTRMKRFLDILSKKRIFRIFSKKRVFCCVFCSDIFFSRITAFHSKVHFFKSSKLDTLSPHAGCFRVLAPKSQRTVSENA